MTWRWVLLVAALLVTAACAPVRIRTSDALLAAQAARERAMIGHDRWIINGRLGVSDGRDGGSGTLTWVEDAGDYDFTLRAPVTGRSFRLHGDAAHAVVEGLDQGTVYGADPQTLLARTLGWRVPLRQLRYWVRGLRAPGSAAALTFAENRLPLQIIQDGWTINYRDWYEDRTLPLPRKVFAERGPYRVRLSVHSWVVR